MGPSTRIDGDVSQCGGASSAVKASMGPSTRIDGDFFTAKFKRVVIVKLQWGRRLASTETHATGWRSDPAARLQWGRRLASTETWRHAS